MKQYKSNYVCKAKALPVMPEQLEADKAKAAPTKGETKALAWKDVAKAQRNGVVSMDVHSHGNKGVTIYRNSK